MFRVELYPNFEKRVKKILDKKEIVFLERIIEEVLVTRGDKVGKIISFYFLRELKIKGKRVYFIIYFDFNIILLINVSRNKKDQQIIIDFIKDNLEEFKSYIFNLFR